MAKKEEKEKLEVKKEVQEENKEETVLPVKKKRGRPKKVAEPVEKAVSMEEEKETAEKAERKNAEKNPEEKKAGKTASKTGKKIARSGTKKASQSVPKEKKEEKSTAEELSLEETKIAEQKGLDKDVEKPRETGSAEEAGKSEEPVRKEGPRDADARAVQGILEIMADGYGFIRSENFLPGEQDVYVNNLMIRRFHLKTGDMLYGYAKSRNPQERYSALLFIEKVNNLPLSALFGRPDFDSAFPLLSVYWIFLLLLEKDSEE